MTVTIRQAARAALAAGALAIVAVGCGGDAGGDDGDDTTATSEAASAETTADEATTTTLSPEDEVLADYNAATEAVQAAFDPPDPQHPDLLATHAGAQLERYQTRLAEYQTEGRSDVLVSKETDPQVISVDDATAVVEDCLTEVLQYTDTVTREPQGEPRTYTVLIRDDLELIDGTWKVVDGRTVEETC